MFLVFFLIDGVLVWNMVDWDVVVVVCKIYVLVEVVDDLWYWWWINFDIFFRGRSKNLFFGIMLIFSGGVVLWWVCFGSGVFG